jgi:hypothetical protein
MKYSLKALLITMCGAGAVAGILGKLLIESPERFLEVLNFGFTIGPFLLAVGTIIWIGLRGATRGPGLVAWGCILLVTPVLVQSALALLWPSRDPLRVLSNWRLIEQRLPRQVDQPWVWNELERRLVSGNLSSQEVDDAIFKLVAFMRKSKPAGWNQPLTWQDDFLSAAIQRKMISEDVFLDLCDAFYGPKPRVQPLPLTAEGDPGFQLEIEYGNPWSNNSKLGVELLFDVGRVQIDGAPATIEQVHQFGERWSGFCRGMLEPGEHQVSIEVECGLVDASQLMGANGAEVPVDAWPTARKRWKSTVTMPIKVEVIKE